MEDFNKDDGFIKDMEFDDNEEDRHEDEDDGFGIEGSAYINVHDDIKR